MILARRYRIIGLLGKGGMGEVYRADDLRLGQPVALKFLPDAVSADAARLAQFHNEVRTARQISHPNICRVYDIGEVDGQLFLSMEFVDGEDLATSLRRMGRFPEDKAVDIARQLCAGLAAAHERGVMHRDLKPANVMLDGAGSVRLMDFGLAAIGPVEDIRVGTPAYMAPEQLQGQDVTPKSDVYALGLVLYEVFTGRRAITAKTLHDLIEHHQSGRITPPGEIISGLDPAIERAILRCLDPNPARRPGSALSVAAQLPGGDPLAAALAAGQTPSPEMVAAAGEGVGLTSRVATAVFVATVAGMAATYAFALRASPIERIHPELTAEVLAQKAREAVRQIGYTDRARDEEYGFRWDEDLIESIRHGEPVPDWNTALGQRPSPLQFWYRSSPSPLTGSQFHHDLLTPGIVTPDDPAPIESGMMHVTLDHQGLLLSFEAIPPQRQDAPSVPRAVEWAPILSLAGLDPATLTAAAPQWNWLATSDTRTAWTGTWPGSGRPLRVEAAALGGRPVAFHAIGPWTTPWRSTAADAGTETVFVVVLFAQALLIAGGGTMLARKHVREGRGDTRGAQAMGGFVAAALWALWVCQVHVSASTGLLGAFLLVICTTVFYAALFWAIYLALEPFVRRHWPQTLVSWTTLLQGRARDPVVGRDVLFGVALGVAIALLLSATELATSDLRWTNSNLLGALRGTVGEVVARTVYAVRTALFVFFLLFLLRVVLRRQIIAAAAFAIVFGVLNALTSAHPLVDGPSTFVYFSLFAAAVLRWGLTTLTVGVFVADLLLMTPATTNPSAWYAGSTLLVTALPIGIAAWAFHTAVSGRLWRMDLAT